MIDHCYDKLIIFYIHLGNSKLAGLMEDIDITGDQFNWAASAFSFGFVSITINRR